jgi:hypothetical protein
MPPRDVRGISLTAAGQQEIETLLHAAFSDSIDFIFVPEPRPFAIYADHDEFTTFFAHTRSNLNHVVTLSSIRGSKRFQIMRGVCNQIPRGNVRASHNLILKS